MRIPTLITHFAVVLSAATLSGCVHKTSLEASWTYVHSDELPPAVVPARVVSVPINDIPRALDEKELKKRQEQTKRLRELFAERAEVENKIAKHLGETDSIAQIQSQTTAMKLTIRNPTNNAQTVYCLYLAFRDLDPELMPMKSALLDCGSTPPTNQKGRTNQRAAADAGDDNATFVGPKEHYFIKAISEAMARNRTLRAKYIKLGTRLTLVAGDAVTLPIYAADCPIPAHVLLVVKQSHQEEIEKTADGAKRKKKWEAYGQRLIVQGRESREYARDRNIGIMNCSQGRQSER